MMYAVVDMTYDCDVLYFGTYDDCKLRLDLLRDQECLTNVYQIVPFMPSDARCHDDDNVLIF